jgi:Kef-type K+ transport system membrane component KefB
MTLKNQYLLAALCCTVGFIFLLVEKDFSNFGLVFIAAGIIFPSLRRLAGPSKEKKIKTKQIKQVTLVNLLLLLLIVWIFVYAVIRKGDLRELISGWVLLALLWFFFMTYLFKYYLIEEAELKEKEKGSKVDET